jgi:cytoskeletal protein CcmA (bactofilin family)
MENNMRGDLRINGSGSAAGGTYGNVKINGSGKITGDLECKEFIINGSGEVIGKIEAEKLRINGSGHIVGDVKAKELKVNGSANLGGTVSGGNISVSGSADIKSGLDMQNVKISGSVKIGGDCNAERFESNGVFDISGLLNADEVDARLYWHRSRAKEIGGGKIIVGLGNSTGLSVLKAIFTLGLHNPGLDADSIEGDEINLENTTARVVRGNNVTIGRGCDIGLVEYKGIYQKNGDAKVAEERKL